MGRTKRSKWLLGVVALILVLATAFQGGNRLFGHTQDEETVTFDVAIDGRTFHLNGGVLLSSLRRADLRRGDTFIVNGTIYPGGTITNNFNSPDDPGGVGKFVCRGTFNLGLTQIIAGQTPHLSTTQHFLMNNGAALMTEGQEGGVATTRAVTGGVGSFNSISFSGAIGEVTQQEIGSNLTGFPNLRVTFRIKKN